MAECEENELKDSELESLAREELLREARNAKRRTETFGAAGWRPCPLPTTNKRFLRNMLLSTTTRSDIKKRHMNSRGSKKNESSEAFTEEKTGSSYGKRTIEDSQKHSKSERNKSRKNISLDRDRNESNCQQDAKNHHILNTKLSSKRHFDSLKSSRSFETAQYKRRKK